MCGCYGLLAQSSPDTAITSSTEVTIERPSFEAMQATAPSLLCSEKSASAIHDDAHLLTVLRYVERNALRANLVSRAEDWPWGSLAWRTSLNPPIALAPSPVRLPSDWVRFVNEPQSTAELEAIRACVNRQQPFGDRGWVEQTAQRLGMAHSLRSPGRPRR